MLLHRLANRFALCRRALLAAIRGANLGAGVLRNRPPCQSKAYLLAMCGRVATGLGCIAHLLAYFWPLQRSPYVGLASVAENTPFARCHQMFLSSNVTGLLDKYTTKGAKARATEGRQAAPILFIANYPLVGTAREGLVTLFSDCDDEEGQA
jgi:hypothetical protein